MTALERYALPPPQQPTRIVAAMSGGVDSSVTAALLARAGYEVIGVTLQLYDHGAALQKKGTCCAGQDIYDARRVAETLGIAHYVLDYEARFKAQVMEEFAAAYGRGETPIPCVACNDRVKFHDLLATAKDLGAAALATGHYVVRRDGAAGAQLHCGADPARDQSYFLYKTTPEQLAFLRFPLGTLAKTAVREMAHELGLVTAAKPDSQDICFVPGGNYAAVVEKLNPEAARPGEIVDLNGTVLGRHDGIIHFTVGQRKRLGLSGNPDAYFVIALDAARARVVVGPRAALASRRIKLRAVNWLLPVTETLPCQVKVRSMRPAVPARVTAEPDGGAVVELLAPQDAVAPGQACVFYDGTRLLGGGTIVTAEPLRAAA
jgi:tRNA-specific 2-thiouridylase